MKLFSIVTPEDLIIGSWIAVKHDWKAVHVKLPWFRKSRLVLAWDWPFHVTVYSSRREMFFDDGGHYTPGYGPPRTPEGRIVGSPIYGEGDHFVTVASKGCAGVEGI